MKILFIQCFDKPGGQSNRSYLFAQELTNLGYQVTYFTNRYNHLDIHKSSKEDMLLDNDVNIIYLNNKLFRNNKFLNVFFNSLYLIKILRKNKFNFIIGPSVPLINSLFAIIFKNKKTKFIYEIRDVWPDALYFNKIISKYNPIYFILKFSEILIYKYSDGLISSLTNTESYVKKYNEKLTQIYLPNAYNCNPSYKKTFNKNLLKIVYVGRFNADHDLEIILQSAKFLLNLNYKDIIFDLYGYGNKLNTLIEYKNINNLNNINFKGSVDKNEIFELLKNYDLALCTINNSKAYNWGLNLNKIYEYFNSGMPVIFSGKAPYNPVKMANCGFVSETFNYIDLSKLILKFKNLSYSQKNKLSNNAKIFFDNNYDIKILIKKLDIFLKNIH